MDPKHSIGPDRIDYKETPGDLTEVHAAIEREHPEPMADVTPVPLWLTALCGFAVASAGMYLGMFHGGFKGDVFSEMTSSPTQLFKEPAGAKQTGPVKVLTAAERGKSVYGGICNACHQGNGQGVPGTFPPLAKSEYVASEKRLIAIILKGVLGPITVEGKQFNNAMPAQGAVLNDQKIADVASYVRASFGNNFPEVTAEKVAAVRKEYDAKQDQWNEAALLQIPADAAIEAAAPAAAPAAAKPEVNPAKLMAVGKMTYSLCLPCHQANGMGLPNVFPPLAKSEYVNGSAERFAAMILKGNIGPFTIDGKTFNNVMPPQEAALADDKVAAVMTYVRANFGNNAPFVDPEVVTAARKKFADRKTPWTEAELKAWKE